MKRLTLSVVFSFRNEAEVLPELLERTRAVLDPLGSSVEFLFVNDASTDQSLEILLEEAKNDSRIRILNMSRRFGVPACLIAGMRHASGDAVITMDADLQDPPEIIPELIRKWEEGADVVYTVRKQRRGETWLKKNLTSVAYQILSAASEIPIPEEAGDFRLLSRRVLDLILKIDDPEPYLRGLVPWAGFKQEPFFYERSAREAGKSHFPLWSSGPWRTFFSGIVSFSEKPLIGILILGFLGIMGSIGFAAYLLLNWFQNGDRYQTQGFPLLLILMASVQLFSIGILGLYLGRILRHVHRRPLYVIESSVGIEAHQPEIIA